MSSQKPSRYLMGGQKYNKPIENSPKMVLEVN